MKIVAIREVKQTLSARVEESQQESVIITRHGKPVAVLVGVEGQDLEEVMLQCSPGFWEMIQTSRRSNKRQSLAELRRRYQKTSRNKPAKNKAAG